MDNLSNRTKGTLAGKCRKAGGHCATHQMACSVRPEECHLKTEPCRKCTMAKYFVSDSAIRG